jgi:hypothetical protein
MLLLATAAAVAATAGDVLMLYVVNARRPELGLAPPPDLALPLGSALGVVAIPLYALGYAAIARAIVARAPALARVVAWTGALGAAIGAIIHGLTGRLIGAALAAGAPAAPPFEAMMAWEGSPLPALWGLASVLVVAGSVAVARAGKREAGLPRAARLVNPAVLTLALGLAGLGAELGRSFLTPAAPNLAHGVFFAWGWRVLCRRPRR